MSDSPDKENKGANGASNPPAAGKKPARIPLPFTILILLLVSGIVLFAILFALQFFYTRNLGNSLPSSVTGTQKESSSNAGGDDGAPISILPEQPGGVTILEKQAESTGGGSAAPSAPVAQGAGIATGFAMDLGAADSFLELSRRFAEIVDENGENNFLRLEPRAVLRETVNGLEARLLIGPFDSEAEAADACSVLILAEDITCTAQPFEGELIPRE